MPKINSITIGVNNQQYVYRAGDEISGRWTVDIGETFSVKYARVALYGAALTRWDNTEPRADDYIGFEEITTQLKTVFGQHNVNTIDFPAGKYTYNFRFRFPDEKLPSSYEGKYGAIRYWLSFEIVRPILRQNIRRIKVLTVLDNVDVNLSEFSRFESRKTTEPLKKMLGLLGTSGEVTLHAQTDRKAYCPGEKIAISMLMENKSDRDLGVVKATLVQKVEFHASGETKYKYMNIQAITGDQLKKGENRRWRGQLLTVPPTPPTTRIRSSFIIKVQYYVKVMVTIPKLQGGDVFVTIPVTIGTIPQGHVESKPNTEVAGASNIHVIDASSALTYVQCLHGFEDCDVSESRFPQFSYVPYCTYVPDFDPKKIQKKPIKPAQSQNNTSQPAKPKPSQVAPLASKSPVADMSSARVTPPALQPTAPPPSYDDVLREMGNEPTENAVQQPCEDELRTDAGVSGVPKADDTVLPTTVKPVLTKNTKNKTLLIRFGDVNLREFRTALVQHVADLEQNGGKVLAVAPQVIVSAGSWPLRTSIAVLVFEASEGAKTWFQKFHTTCEASKVQIADAAMYNRTTEEFVNEKSVFTLTTFKIFGDLKSAEWKQLLQAFQTIYKPARLGNGGVLLQNGIGSECLVGNGIAENMYVSLSQWDSIGQKYEYKKIIEDMLKARNINVKLENFMTTELNLVFQTENLSYIEDAIDSN